MVQGQKNSNEKYLIGILESILNQTEYLELETERDYPDENKIWPDLVDILHTDDVDFVVLNRARPSLVYNVLRVGMPLAMKDKRLYLELLCKTSYEAMDWWDFVNDFWEISERAGRFIFR